MQGLSLPTQPRDRVVAKAHLGFIDYVRGNYEAAGQDYWRALRIKLHPDERRQYMPLVYINIGLMAFHNGDLPKALKAYKTAFKYAPHLPAVRAGLALLHGASGEIDKAEAMWRVLIEEHSYFIHPEAVIARHFRWSPRMADLVKQLQPYIQDDIVKHLTLTQASRLLEVTEPILPQETVSPLSKQKYSGDL
jgi:tetratricopeptide (TPR) repeat protein